MNIAMIGTGYVGLVTGSCFAETGNDVVCVDIDEAKIAQLRGGTVPFYELGLEELIERNTREGRLSFSTDLAEAVKRAEAVFIAVGTPQVSEGGADLSQVFAVAEDIARAMNGGKIVVTKSTVPVGTAVRVKEIIEAGTGHPVAVVSNPEFLKEGTAVEDFMKPDRVVLGGEDTEALERLKGLYEPFVRRGNPIILTDSRSAEMSKYAANAMLATKISFINETARLCEKEGADIEQVRRVMGLDHRIGPHFIYPGIGFGGSCLPKDIRAMIAMGGDELEMPLASGRGPGQRNPEGFAAAEGQAALRRGVGGEAPWRSGALPSRPVPTTCARPRPCGSSTGCWRPARECARSIPRP